MTNDNTGRVNGDQMNQLHKVSLSAKLVALIIVLLTIGTLGISLSIRQLVNNYMNEKTDSQLLQQAELVFKNTDILNSNTNTQNGMTSYYVKAYNKRQKQSVTLLQPVFKDGVVSSPQLPDDGNLNGHQLGVPFTAPAVVSLDNVGKPPDHATLQTAEDPWRVVALKWINKTDNGHMEDLGIVYIALSMSNQIEMIDTLTKFCAMVGVAVVLLGAVLSAIAVQNTLSPLKHIEKIAAAIAAGDLSQRIEKAPINTEVGSLSHSLNVMLAQIEQSFRDQQLTTAKMKRFVSDASHELRTPLAAIHGYAELYKMQRGMPGALERADDSIEHIEASSSRMTILVEDLLSLARLDEGRGISITDNVHIGSVIRDSVDDLHALDPKRTITTGTLHLTQDLRGQALLVTDEQPIKDVVINGDSSRLRQVITNIVGNIHRYTPPDSPVQISLGEMPIDMDPLEICVLPTTQESLDTILQSAQEAVKTHSGMQYAVIQIVDHGPGVSDQLLPKIFERFFTADPSRDRQKGGTGLGMAIALSVVTAHHGFICPTHTLGGGLTFTIVLPVQQEHASLTTKHDAR